MTPHDLLAEQFDHRTSERPADWLPSWTPTEQGRHRKELLDATRPAGSAAGEVAAFPASTRPTILRAARRTA